MIEYMTGTPEAVTVERTDAGGALVTLRRQTGEEAPVAEAGEAEQAVCEMYQYETPYDAGLEAYVRTNFEAIFAACAEREERALAGLAREKRDALLLACDYTAATDYPATDTERNAWLAYRQALRDMPEQAGFPHEIIWPVPPAREKAQDTILAALDATIGGE